MPLLGRRRPPARALVASARTLKVGNERDALLIRRTRQPWQPAAWSYRDNVGEIGYAMRFLANSLSRIRLYAAAYDDPLENPVPVGESTTVPDDVAKLADAAIAELGAGQLALSGLIKPLVENTEIVGECYLVSDPAVITDQLWSIRSMDEIEVLDDGEFLLRDQPDQRLGTIMPQGRPLSADAYVARMWTPHPRFHAWADSPMRQLIDPCDELLLLSRSVRAIARSRLTGPGILAVAEEFSLTRAGAQDTDDDPNADTFTRELTETMMEPIGDEGSAAAVVPIILRAPYDMVEKGIQHFAFDRLLDTKSVELRAELIGRIATGLDLPKEVITGTADLNHWSSWQIDDNTFRHHIEPKVLTMVDCLTVAYLRVRLLADGVPQEMVDRLVVWYDPTELVTHPDRTADALQVWDRFGISNETLRDVAGWNEGDAPSSDEMLLRMLMHERTFPPTIIEALFNKFAPGLRILPDLKEPGMGPGDVTEPPDTAAPPAGETPAGVQPGPPKEQPTPTAPPPVPAKTRLQTYPPRNTFQTRAPSRLSRRLMNVDRSLRDRLVAASDAAVRRTLERAGNRARAKVSAEIRGSLTGIPTDLIPATLGADTLGRFGLDEETLVDDQFTQLKASWSSWLDDANRSALTAALAVTGLSVDDPRVQAARKRQEQAGVAGWAALAAALAAVTHRLLFDPRPDRPDLTPSDVGAVVVPAGTVRSAVAVAGGGTERAGLAGRLVAGSAVPVPGITSGPILGDVMRAGGQRIAGYTWTCGAPVYPFPAHDDLCGESFTDWADDLLVPGDSADWMGISNYFPGDHDGCQCDVDVDWVQSETEGG